MTNTTKIIVGALVTALLLGALGPTIFEQLAGFAGDASLSTAEAAVAGVVGIFVMLAVAKKIMNGAGAKVGA